MQKYIDDPLPYTIVQVNKLVCESTLYRIMARILVMIVMQLRMQVNFSRGELIFSLSAYTSSAITKTSSI